MKTNRYTLLILILLFRNFIFGQVLEKNIVGIWQADSSEVTSMYHDTYQFYKNGNFEFKPDGYNGLNRVLSINGRYELKKDTVLLYIKSTKEIVGGYPNRSEITTLSDTWEIINGKIKTFTFKKNILQKVKINKCSDEKCILIDDRKFYLIEE